MSPIRSLQAFKTCRTLVLTVAVLGTGTQYGSSQPATSSDQRPAITPFTSEAALVLPDAPSVSNSGTSSSGEVNAEAGNPASSLRTGANLPASGFDPVTQPAMASSTDKYILPGQQVPSLRASDKFVLGIKDAISPLSVIGWLASAGYAHAIDGPPHYGTNSKAFAQRFGAAAARAGSEGIFSDSIMSPLFREDPRYYKLGRGHSFGKRVVYSATRAIITRTDSGHSTPNLGLITGNLEGAALTNLYYPESDRTFKQTSETFAGSIGGSALGFVVSEFLSDTLKLVHLTKE